MLDSFWNWWGRYIVRHPRRVVFVTLALMGLFAIISAFSKKDLSFLGLLDEQSEEIMLYQETVREFGSTSTLVLLLEGESDDLDAAVDRFATELPDRANLKALLPPADPQWLIDRGPWIWPELLFKNALKIAEGKPNPLAEGSINASDKLIERRLNPVEKARLIQMEFNSDMMDMAMGGEEFAVAERETRAMLEEMPGVTGEFSGIMAVGAQDQASVLTRIRLLTPITMIIVLFLLRGVETRFSRLMLAGVSLAGSVVIAFGLVGMILGVISITASFFGMLLLGLGIDFAIHLLVAMRDERAANRTPEDAVVFGIDRTGTAILLGGVTTGLATSFMLFVPEPGARDMGLTATFGLLGSLVLMLSFLPAAWLLLERRHKDKADPPPRFDLPGLRSVVTFSIDRPRTVLLITALMLGFALYGLRFYHMETDIEKIFTKKVKALEVEDRINELYGLAPTVYVAPVDDLEQAAEWSERLRAMPTVAEVFSPSDWLRDDSDSRRKAMETALANAAPDNAIAQRLKTALEAGPVTPESVPPSLRSGIIGASGKLGIRIAPLEAPHDSIEIQKQIDELRAAAPTATGMLVISCMLMSGQNDWVPVLMLGIGVIVFLVLVVSFRNPRHIFLAMLPVVVSAIFSLGMFCWFGLSLSILTTIVIPVILGLGVDDGIHVMERLRRYEDWTDENIHEAIEGVGRAIFLTSATTTASFLGLFFSNHFGLESIAQFMSLGVPMCFLSSVTVLPAMAKLLR